MLHEDEEWFDEPEEESRQKLDVLIKCYTSKSSGRSNHGFHAITECSSLLDAVKKYQKLLDIDLIILSSKADIGSDKENENILEHVRGCPILLMPAHASIDKKVSMTIASDFKQKINTSQIDRFRESLNGKHVEIGILVLDKQNQLPEIVTNNLETFMGYLRQFQNTKINLEYAKTGCQLKVYASSNPSGIMCLVDKKPDLLRKLGLLKSDVISKLKQLNSSTVLTVHQ